MQLHSQDIRCNCGLVFRTMKTLFVIVFCLSVMGSGFMLLSAIRSSRRLTESSSDILSNILRSISNSKTKLHEPGTTDPLLREAAKISAHSRTLMVPILNNAYLPFAYNWLCNTKEMGLHQNMLIITTDDESSETITRDWPEVSVVSLHTDSVNGDKRFAEAGFLRVTVKRHQALYKLLKQGYEILHFDLDQFWTRNPLKFLQGHTAHDLLVTKVTGIENEYCIGFVYIFNTEKTLKLWKLLVDKLEEGERKVEKYNDSARIPFKLIDQSLWSDIIRAHSVEGLEITELSLDEFADGRWYKRPESERQALNPYLIHNNFISGNSAKKKRAQDHGYWFLHENMTCNMDAVHKVVKND